MRDFDPNDPMNSLNQIFLDIINENWEILVYIVRFICTIIILIILVGFYIIYMMLGQHFPQNRVIEIGHHRDIWLDIV